jgi:hypothetical protein
MDFSPPVRTVVRVATHRTQYALSEQIPDCLTVVPKLTFDDPNSIFEKRIPAGSPWDTAGSGGKWVEKDGPISLQHKGQMLEDSCRPEGTFRPKSMLCLERQIGGMGEEGRVENDGQL